jgi:tripartite tricarboxylate transporter family receptor
MLERFTTQMAIAGSRVALCAGNLRILAVGSSQRVPVLPDIPTLQETGVAGFKSITWFAVMAPPETPTTLTEAINKAIAEALHLPDVKEQFAKMGIQPMGSSVAETARFIGEIEERQVAPRAAPAATWHGWTWPTRSGGFGPRSLPLVLAGRRRPESIASFMGGLPG